MSRRRRAVGFAAVAVVCAVLAGLVTQSYADRYRGAYGPLVPVVVTARPLAAGRTISERTARRFLVVRRVPRRFVPPDAVSGPLDAVGLRPAAVLPTRSYVLGSQLRAPARDQPRRAHARAGTVPVDVRVAGGTSTEALSPGDRVDVLARTEDGAGRVRARIVERGAALQSLEPAGASETDQGDSTPGHPEWLATLAVRRREAVGLVAAEADGEVRLLRTGR